MIEIELNNIKKNFGLKNILDGFSLEIKKGERVALIGQNGAGKSTILKIIAKQEKEDSGKINIRSGARIGILNQIYNNEKEDILVKDFLYRSFEDVLSIESELRTLEEKMSNPHIDAENLENLINKYGRLQDKYVLLGGYDIAEKIKKITSKFYIDANMMNQHYNLLSGGEKTRVNLAKLILSEPDILCLDEPTNHLDIESLEFLEELIFNYKGTVLIVSHDRYFLDKVITKTVLLENGKENIYYGNYSYFVKEDERRTLAQFENYKNQQKQIEKMKEAITTLRKFGDIAKNEMFYKRAKSIEKRLEKMSIIDKPIIEKKPINIKFKMQKRSGNDVVKIENLEKAFDEKVIFENLNMNINYGEKVALIGKNGSGKSTLIKMILGEDNNYKGTIKLGTSIEIGYIPQNIIFENEKETILNYFIKDTNLSETEARTILAKYGFRQENVFKKVGNLSGGEKVRILLMKLIQKNINFLILDEPTNHIDIDTREILEDALKSYNGTVLFISHDRFLINKLAERILHIEENNIQSYYGNYDNFMRRAQQNECDN